jgi:hypothetical protein
MIYDTACGAVIVNNEGLENAELISNYDVKESETAKAKSEDEPTVSMPLGSVDFEGVEYTDNMCLY